MRALDVFRPDPPARSGARPGLSMRSGGWAEALLSAIAANGLITTTWGKTPSEPVAANLRGHAAALLGNGPIATMVILRGAVFSEARLLWQRILTDGRPGELHRTAALDVLERPWLGGTTGDLATRALLDADLAGNWYVVRIGDELVRLRPDWVHILMRARHVSQDTETARQVGWERVGIAYYEGGLGVGEPAIFLPGEFGHFAPLPDPLATWRGMSWLTPVVREIESDNLATEHKKRFYENAATPNLAVSLAKEVAPDAFNKFVELMESQHSGVENAGRTLYMGGGADVTVVGADMKALDFAATQGKGETRIANAAGVPAVLAGLSEGLQGSSLNAGNYASAKRRFSDATMRPLWRNWCGSLESLIPPPPQSRLWYDTRDIAFLRDDEKDASAIQNQRALTIRALVDAGFLPDSVVAAVEAENWTLLKHSNLYSVQLQPPGAGGPAPAESDDPDPSEEA